MFSGHAKTEYETKDLLLKDFDGTSEHEKFRLADQTAVWVSPPAYKFIRTACKCVFVCRLRQ